MTDDGGDAPTRDGEHTSTGFRLSAKLVGASNDTRYRRGGELARGGIGRVTEAYDSVLRRDVAIKELHRRTEQSRQRFELESLTTARLQHPAIVPVFDVGTSDTGDPYLVLQLLRGTTLAEEIQRRPTFEARLALLPSILAVADALGYAHEQGVVHRDVKPSNVMLGKHGETVLLDWGVAFDPAVSIEGDAITSPPDAVVGTPRFMSREQARNESPVPGFDVYSLGAMLATLLSGIAPFAEVPAEEILPRVRDGEPCTFALPPEAPTDLAAIVAKATAPAAERYPHAGAVAEDLRRFISGQLVGARRYTPRQLLVRWLRRHRIVLAAAIVTSIAAVVAVGSVVHAGNVAVHERQQALERAHELVLLQARLRIATDATATVAWLKDYPAGAPHQEELLALIDEAEGRGVARHVWHPTSATVDAAFADDGALVVAASDGEILRIDVASGRRQRLAKLSRIPMFLRTFGTAALVLDESGDLWRITPSVVRRVAELELPSRPNGLHVTARGEVKVTFADNDALWIGHPTEPEPAFAFTDDENDTTAVFGVTATGELDVGDPTPRKVWQFVPRTWVRGSADGSRYLAIAPDTDHVILWLGAIGEDPIQLATARLCTVGEDRAQTAEISPDGKIVIVWRCGVLVVYDTVSRHQIPLPDSERVTQFVLSPDGAWLGVGHSDGLDLVELATGAYQRMDAGSLIISIGFQREGKAMFSVGIEQGVRVWPLHRSLASTGRLGEVVTPVRLYLGSPGEIAVRRHLDCATWSVSDRRMNVDRTIQSAEVRQSDDETLLWPWDGSDDGRACIFAGRDGSAVVVGADGMRHTIGRDLDDCVLSSDGDVAWCIRATAVVSIEVATNRQLSSRAGDAAIRGIVRYRGRPIVLVQRAKACTLETVAGDPIARLPGAADCASVWTSGNGHPGDEAALVIARASAFTIWNEHGVLDVSSALGRIEVSRETALAAVLQQQQVEIWNLRTRSRVEGPPADARAIEHAAWSSTGVLATSDDEVVQLWNSTTHETRAIYAPHVASLVWSADGHTLYTTDGKLIQAWPFDKTRDRVSDIRARLDELTTARIVDGRATTPE